MLRSLSCTLFVALFLTACQGVTSQDPMKIGYIGPLTGEAASYGIDTVNGVKLAVDEVNAAGGVNGRQILLMVEDGRCTGADAASAARKLTSVDKVVAIIGGQCSGETLAAAPIAEAAQVPMISPVSSSPDVTAAGSFVFRNYPSDALKTKVMADAFREKGYAKVAVISENTDFAIAFRNALKMDAGEDAMTFDEVVEPNTKDFRSLFTRLKEVPFDIFFPNGQSDTTVAVMMQQFREAGFTQPAISHDVADSATLGEIAPEAVEGMQVISVTSLGESPFAATFRAAYGEPEATMTFAAHAYDAANVLFAMLKQGAEDGPAIRDALLGLESFPGVAGTFHFDANGDVVGIPYALKEFHDGILSEVARIPLE